MKTIYLLVATISIFMIFNSCGSNSSTPQYSLTLSASPTEGGTATSNEPVYDEGSTATITATANPEWVFVRWEGDYGGTTNPATVSMNTDKNIVALFEKKSYALTVNTSGEGTVDEQIIQAKSTDYESGTVVELTANPAVDWEFVRWEGAITGTTNPAQIIIDEPKQVTAIFEQHFSLASNGVTIICDAAQVGDSGSVNGVTYTKRSVDQITSANAPTTCTSGITDMSELFRDESSFNGDISHWDVSSVTTMFRMFQDATSFNQDLNYWDVSSVTNMVATFHSATSFNGDISHWDVSAVASIGSMFFNADSFMGDISGWDVSSVTSMGSMFGGADAFNGDISGWNVSSVTSMAAMFNNTISFDQDLSAWDVSSVTRMEIMFSGADSFNGDISSWDVSSVNSMNYMFADTDSFNNDISNWDVSNVAEMENMFFNASAFNQDLTGWCVTNIPSEPIGFAGGSSALLNENFPVWGTCPGL
jgi:surface protein